MGEAPLAEERRQKILDELRSRGMVRTAELAQHLGVSDMTVHRDLDRLAALGLVRKVFGGAVAAQTEGAMPGCAVCGATSDKRIEFTVHLIDGASRLACCPHCGLMLLQQLGNQARSAVTFDFISRQTVNAREATYVFESAATPCCAPSLLAFRVREDAERFQAGFGGRVADFRTAMTWVTETMGLELAPSAGMRFTTHGGPTA